MFVETFLKEEEKMSKFYSNQIDAANKIYQHFIEGNKKVLLFAQMQSGKTGTYSCLIQKLKMNKNWKSLLGVEDIVVILADSNTAVKDQIKKDLNDDSIRVLHRSTSDRKIFKEIRNTLVILDESHTAEKDINVIAKDVDHVTNSLLTVSATDFHNDMVSSKNIPRVILSPGENYYGIVKMLENRMVKQSDRTHVKNKINPMFSNELESLVDQCKYSIIRVSSHNESINLKKLLSKTHSNILVKIVNVKENKQNMDLSFLGEIPKLPTVVIINGAARMGRQIDTSNLFFVWDTLKSNTDTCVQGLLGRCCGYNKETHKVKIFTDLEKAKEYNIIVKDNFNTKNKSFTTNTISSTKDITEYTIPIKIQVKKFPKTKKERNLFIKDLTVVKKLLSKYGTENVGTIRDLAELKSNPERREDLLNAIDKGNSYGYGVKEGRMFGISIDTRYNEVFIMEKLDIPKETINVNKKANTHHVNYNNKRGV